MIKEWIEDLESGNFIQGTGALYRDGKYCCLGVLLQRCAPGMLVNHVSGDEEFIPQNVCNELGIGFLYEESDYSDTVQSELIGLNDHKRYNFHEIAKWLRHRYNVD